MALFFGEIIDSRIGYEIYKMNLEHLVVPESKEVLKTKQKTITMRACMLKGQEQN